MISLITEHPGAIIWILGIAGTLIMTLVGLLFAMAKSTIQDLKTAIQALNKTLGAVSEEFKARDHIMDKRISRIEQICGMQHNVAFPELKE